MTDALHMLAAMRDQAANTREQTRRDFPFATAFADQLREAFGDGVKLRYAREGGKEIGKPQPFDGTDVDKLIRHIDMADKRRAKGAR